MIILRKVLAALFCALFSPLIFNIRWLPNVYNAIFYERYEYYDFHITSLKIFLISLYGETYLLISALSLLLVFFPFQFIKDLKFKKGVSMSWLEKALILSGIVMTWILVFGLFSNIWAIPWHKNFIYIAFALFFGFLFTTLLYFMVDKKIEKLK